MKRNVRSATITTTRIVNRASVASTGGVLTGKICTRSDDVIMGSLYMSQYVGGKSKVGHLIYKQFPDTFATYLEGFFGMGSVYLNMPVIEDWRAKGYTEKRLPVMLVNDYDKGIHAINKAILKHPTELWDALGCTISHEETKKYYTELEPTNDWERAVQLLYVLHANFGSKWKAGFSYSLKEKRKDSLVWPTKDFVLELKRRLSVAKFFSMDWKAFLDRFLGRVNDPFIYLDPPYYKVGAGLYRHGVIDHEDMAKYLIGLEGVKWLVSYDDVPEVRELYDGYNITSLRWNYSHKGSVEGKEVLISNYIPSEKKKAARSLF